MLNKYYFGNNEVDKIYFHDNLFYQKDTSGELLPIQDGLVCWLDGSDTGTGDTWLDKSGKGNNATLNDYIRDQKFVQINGYASMPNVTKNLANYTIEFNYETTTSTVWNALFTNRNVGNNGYCLNLNDTNIQFYNGTEVQAPLSFGNLLMRQVILTIKVENSIFTFYKDGVKYDTLDLGLKISTTDIIAINTRTQNDGSQVFPKDSRSNKWYSFKVYNRALTDSEIMLNYEYEQSRV